MRKLFAFAAPFSVVVFALHYGVWPLALLVLLPALVKREDRRLRCALVCGGLLCGLLWCQGYDAFARAPARALEGRGASLSAAVTDWPRASSYGGGVVVRVHPDEGASFLARLYGDETILELEPGDSVSCQVQCRTPEWSRGETSGEQTAKGIFLLAYVQGSVERSHPERLPLWALPAHWGRALKQSISAALPEGATPLVTALLTGDKSALSGGDYVALQRAGLAHAVAVSGLHIGFLVQLAVALSGSRHRKRTALMAIPLMVAYALMVGGTPSVVRAVIMNALLLLGALLGRETDPPTTLSLALMLLLLQNPYAAQSLSLQLSFASVAGISAFGGPIQNWLEGGRGWKRQKGLLRRLGERGRHFLTTSMGTTLGAMAFTLPLTAFYFGSVSLVSPLANLLCLPLVEAAFLGGLASAGLGLLLPQLGVVLGLVAALPVELLLRLTRALAAPAFSSITLESGYLKAWLVLLYVIWVLFLAFRGRRPVVAICCSVMALCCALVLTHMTYHLGPLTTTVLSVGQGQSVVLSAGERTAVVDCGGNARRNAGDLCADYLATMGRTRLDLLVLTHFHDDHANGVLELFARMEVDVLAVADVGADSPLRREILAAAQAQGTQIYVVEEDAVLPFGSAQLTLYAPLGAGDANEEGLSVLCQAGEFSALLTGDMGTDIEARLVKYGALPQVALLLAGHHGSKNATSQHLLDTVQPDLCAISSGYNTYGHPAPETLLRLEGAGCDIYRTDLQGNITVTVGP